jgi:hypothetical protein
MNSVVMAVAGFDWCSEQVDASAEREEARGEGIEGWWDRNEGAKARS